MGVPGCKPYCNNKKKKKKIYKFMLHKNLKKLQKMSMGH